MKKKRVWIVLYVVLILVVAYMFFCVGRYSYLIRKPEILLSGHEKWFIEKAHEHAIEVGVSEERLTDPRIVETIRVYFGEGIPGAGGVEVTIVKSSGDMLNVSY